MDRRWFAAATTVAVLPLLVAAPASRADTQPPAMRTWVIGTDSEGRRGLFYRDGTSTAPTLFRPDDSTGTVTHPNGSLDGRRLSYEVVRPGGGGSVEVTTAAAQPFVSVRAPEGRTPFAAALSPDSAFLLWAERGPALPGGEPTISAYSTNLGHVEHRLLSRGETPVGWMQDFLMLGPDDGGPPHLLNRDWSGNVYGRTDLPVGAHILSLFGSEMLWCTEKPVRTSGHTHCADLHVASAWQDLPNHRVLLSSVADDETIRSAAFSLDGQKVHLVIAEGYVSGEHEGLGDVWTLRTYASGPDDQNKPVRTLTPELDERAIAFTRRPEAPLASAAPVRTGPSVAGSEGTRTTPASGSSRSASPAVVRVTPSTGSPAASSARPATTGTSSRGPGPLATALLALVGAAGGALVARRWPR